MANPANTLAYVGNDGRLWVDVTEAKTLAATDIGYVQNVIYANAVVTCAATAVPGVWTVRNGGVAAGGTAGSGDDGNLITVNPNASDTFIGINVADGTTADGKGMNNTAATSHVGDEITVLSTAATNGPYIIGLKGTWARTA